jgi:hypothetical protein
VNSIETNRFERDQLEALQADRELRQQDYQYSPRNLKGGLWRRDDDGSWWHLIDGVWVLVDPATEVRS